MSKLMSIGVAARKSGVSAKTIRHYEQTGLLPAPARTDAGYRLYSEQAVQQLQFIRQSRRLGFSAAQIRELLVLWHDEHRASVQVKQLVVTHIHDVEQQITQLQQMLIVLHKMAQQCAGDDSPHCAILNQIANNEA
ncbi:Cu(I)-responsive transcriptional regulator [Chromatiaceae bacterium AAb-1]|nr:Cu(I)-responsive transcriptional regulator [Chromatiaceae bacterium AAb-1]